jgi:acyl-CoA synthetase (AMP-forming)/AMP-acid ligase II
MAGTRGHSPRAVDIVRARAEAEGDRVCLTFHGAAGEADAVTYGALAREAAACAALFRARGLGPGDAVVLLARTTPQFVSALLGAQQAGMLAMPCPAPAHLESGRRVGERVDEILRQSGARAVFDPRAGAADPDLVAALTVQHPAVLTADDLGEVAADARGPDAPGPFAYCQFTSGSGGRAKGVLLTHANVAANVRARREAYGLGEDAVAVAWLPLYHDMGLVGYVLGPLLERYPGHLLAPTTFVARPMSWLSLISEVRGTISSAPNFAYAVCTRRATDDDLARLDLSSWRCACNGAEPVTRDVVDAFARRFAAAGFRPSAMLPAYGLAEATLTVTARRPGEGPHFETLERDALEGEGVARPAAAGSAAATVASVGRPLPGQEVAVRGAGGETLGARRIGEIAVRGDCVMHGYLPGTQGEIGKTAEGWLLTGDLGYLADGELFVVGRRKDVIIRAGRNYYPQDIEDAACRVEGVRAGRAVAFAVPGAEGERMVVAVECRDPGAGADQVGVKVRQAVFDGVRLVPDEVVVLPSHALPLTTSGKPMRPEVRRLYLAGALGSRGSA